MKELFKKYPERFSVSALVVLAALVYCQVLLHDFVNYDDPLYVTANHTVRNGLTIEGIAWAFTTFHAYNWHPVTWISHMLDFQLFGWNPAGHHFVNLLFHLANTLLLYAVLKRMTGAVRQSLFAAALFALHPLHVESVAWVAERKDVLCAFFWLLTMLAYVRYARSPGLANYFIVVLFFALGLMSKPMLVTLPFVLLLLDYWPLGRLRPPMASLVLEKIPLLALSLASSVVTYLAQERGGALALAGDGTLATKAVNALAAYAAYIKQTFWPLSLAVYYPPGTIAMPVWQVSLAGICLVLVTIQAIRKARRYPFFAVGWLWYLGTLVPVIGLVKIGTHAIADRYTYIPLVGLFLVIAWGAEELPAALRWKNSALAPSAVAVLAVLSILTFLQARHWRNDITLYEHALEATDRNWLAHKNLAAALVSRGDLPKALAHAAESVRIRPDPYGYTSLGWIHAQLGDIGRSIESCREALRMDPNHAKARYILAMDYIRLGENGAAVREYNVLKTIDAGLARDLAVLLGDGGPGP